MLKRKIEQALIDWKNTPGHSPLIIKGCRQCGKTYSVREFARKHYKHEVYLNFFKNPAYISIFEGSLEIDNLIIMMSALLGPAATFEAGETVIILDEIQDCPEARTALKFFKEDGRFDVIGTGSLLGVRGYGKQPKSIPVGSETVMEMHPLDFEEFLQVFNVKPELIESLRTSFEKRVAVDETINKKLLSLFNLYLLIGGMPSAVMRYVETNSLEEVYKEHTAIIEQYKQDFTKYEAQDKKFYLTQVYDLIPAELSEKNKRFNFADIKKGLKFERAQDNFIWLQKAGVALPVFNAAEPKIPLLLSEKSNLFKLFLSDVGMLTTMYGRATKIKILSGEKDVNNGALYENAMAQELCAHGYKPYYFNSKKQGELDFVIEYHGEILPIEVKSGKSYTVHSALNNVLSNEDYGIKQAFVFANCNISVDEKIVYYPIYFCMFLKEEDLILPKIPKVDLSQV